jgi:exosome complex RNA-binding protein Csl4
MTAKPSASRAAAAAAIAAAIGVTAPCAALAQPVTSLTDVRQASEKVTVVSIDRTTRHMVVRKASGETAALKVPPEVRNFDNLQPGDTISATYSIETEYALSPPNKPLPKDTQTLIAARAEKGELPAAVVANHMIVTGAVLGVDMANHTVKVVSPQGGEVHTVDVKSAEGRRLMGQLKPGDKITAYVTESLLMSASRG